MRGAHRILLQCSPLTPSAKVPVASELRVHIALIADAVLRTKRLLLCKFAAFWMASSPFPVMEWCTSD